MNSDQRHYNRAPIVEAALGFRISAQTPERLDRLQAVGQEIIADYPIVSTLSRAKAKDAAPEIEGYSFTSTDSRQIVKARLRGFSFHRTEPYDSWEPFVAEARRTWQVYAQKMSPVSVTNLSVRYINVLRIPFDIPLHEFFNVYPATPNRDTLFSKLLMFFETDIDELPGTLNVRMAPTDEHDEQHFRMLLDNMFVFRIRDESKAWESMDLIRKIKNSTFESQLTEKLKETLA